MAVNPKSMAIILVFSAAVLTISTAAISSMPPPAAPLPRKAKSVETCVKLLFDPPRRPPAMLRRILCRDLLRAVAMSYKITGKLSPEYVAALKKLPKFRNNPEALNKFLRGLSPAHYSSACDHKTTNLPAL